MRAIGIDKAIDWNTKSVKQAALTVRAINHKLRERMLNLIYSAGRISVTDIYINMRLEQSVCSQHLGILKRAGFVSVEREGKFLIYSIVPNRVEVVKEAMEKMNQR